jgi:hypothetical protein
MAFRSFLKSHFSLPNKKVVLFSLTIILLLGIFLPLQSVNAFNLLHYLNPVTWFNSALDGLASIGKGLLNAITLLIFTILNAIAVTILDLSQAIFRWVSSPNFMGVSFTGPDNIVVQEGWKMLRNFANVGLLLGLIFIGLATAFNAAGYNTKKLLLRLLVAALVVNFTPILCGAVIDGSNIFTNYFLSGASNLTKGSDELFAEELTTIAKDILKSPGIVLIKALVFLSFNLILAFVLLTFAALFVFRYAILWMLVILSPLAILAWALGELSSQLKGIWNQWLKNFVNWSIIAVPAAFVIYLADHLLAFAKKSELVAEHGDIASFSPSFSRAMVEYGLPIVFLLVGFFFTLSSGAMGASIVTKFAKKTASKAGKYAKVGAKAGGSLAGRSAVRRAAGAAAGASKARETETSGFARWTIAPIKGGLKGAFSGEAADQGIEKWATKEGKAPWNYAQRAVGRKIKQSEESARKARQAKAAKFDLKTNASRYLDTVTSKGKLAIVAQAVEKGQLGELAKETGIGGEEAKKIYQSALQLDDRKTAKAIERHFGAEIGEDLGKIAENTGHWSKEQQEKDRTEKGYTSYTEKIVAEAKNKEDIQQLSNSLGTGKANSEAINQAIHKFWNGDQIEKAIETAGAKFTSGFRSISRTPEDYLKVDENTGQIENVDLAYYRNSTAAQKSGLGFSGEVHKEELDEYLLHQQEVALAKQEEIRKAREKFEQKEFEKRQEKRNRRKPGKFDSRQGRRSGKFSSHQKH